MDAKLKEAYKKYGLDLVKELIKQLKAAGKTGSGKLIKSLKPDIKEIGESVNVSLKGEAYINFVDKGRKPGKYPNINAISKWCKLKDIPQSAVFPIAHKIFKFGIKPTNVISKTMVAVGSKSPKQVEQAMADVIEKDLIKTYNETK